MSSRLIVAILITVVVILGIVRQSLPDERVDPVYDWISDHATALVFFSGLALCLAAYLRWRHHHHPG